MFVTQRIRRPGGIWIMQISRLAVLIAALTLGSAGSVTYAAEPSGQSAGSAPIAVKVMIVNLFSFEAAPWLKALHAEREIRVPGLSKDYPVVHCTADGVCEVTTGMGHANAAASIMAVQLSGLFDLRKTYFLVAGIAGIDPAQGTLGSAAWARYVVDTGIAHEIDARELPSGWQDGYFGVLTDAPGQKPQFDYKTEVFRLDEGLLQKALELSQHVILQDSDDARNYRQHYSEPAARNPPQVIQCDTASGDTWWAGRRLGEHARSWTKLLTDGKGVYCTTQQEDNATLNALTRGAEAGLVDLKRVAVLRSGSDFDRPYPHQPVIDSMLAQRKLAGAARISAENLVLAGMPVVTDIVQHWDRWQIGVPGASTK